MNSFATNLQKLRKERFLTQKQMAEILEITPNAYQNYEYGKREPNLDVLIFIADFFEVSLDDLVGRFFSKNSLVNTE